MSIVLYMNNCAESIDSFDHIFRFYRKICFVCTSNEQIELIKKQFLVWLETHDFPVDYSFNLARDVHRNGECFILSF